jgi:hypothetical protein
MSSRTTRKDVDNAIDLLNKLLENQDSAYRVMLKSYNDYYHVEKYDSTDMAVYGYKRCQYDAVYAGSLSECNSHVRAMITGINLYTQFSKIG